MAHARQAVCRRAHALRIEALAVVGHFHDHVVGVVLQHDGGFGGLGVLADVGQALLHHAVDRELARLVHGHGLQRHLDLQARALSELAPQDFQRGDQPEVGERRRPQVLDDAALQRDAAVEQLGQMLQALDRVGRVGQARLQPRHVELGGREQRAQFVVQFARQVAALGLAHVLQVGGELGQRGGALAHLVF
ncbi:hypothetical protein D9M69_568460 [compost metagenome]